MRLKLALLAAVVLTATVWYIYHLGGERATLQLRLRASDSTVAALSARTARVDTLYRTDTLRLRVAVDRWRDKTRWDTVTVPVPAETVKVIIRTADAALNACSVVVQTCEQRVAVRDSTIAELRAQRPLLTQQPSKLTRFRQRATDVLIGASVGYLAGTRKRQDPL